MKSYSNEWRKITSDPTILQAIEGYKLEFELGIAPVQNRVPRPYKLTEDEVTAIDDEINTLLTKGVIAPSCHEQGQYVSNIFTRAKKNGGHRMILDLSDLNQYIKYRHFKMDTFECARALITKNCYMTSLDFRDAYYTVPIAECDRKYLKFIWKDRLYHYNVLPNGLSSGPRIFTKILKPPFATLRSLGYIITGYIDDSLLVQQSKQKAEKAAQVSAVYLEQLGFSIHTEKSVFKATQVIEYLGFIINSIDMRVLLPTPKQQEIKEVCNNLLSQRRHKIRSVAVTIGKIVATFPAVQYGPLHYRALEKDKIEALKLNCGHFDRFMYISDEAREDLQWWINNIDSAYSLIYRGKPDVQISTDASGLGWGATDGSNEIGGRWNESEAMRAANNEINYLELLAAFLALKSFCPLMRNVHVKLQIDNTTAVAYIAHMGGSKSPNCNELAKQIWGWCIDRCIWLTVAHLPGVQNEIADRKSRVFDEQTEWMLDREIFQKLCEFLQFHPEIDLFASRLNTQLTRYMSWKPDPGAEAVDALSCHWNDKKFYAFPPFCLIGKCLQKIAEDTAEGIMIIPKWPTQAWFPKLLSMLIDEPVVLPRTQSLLTNPMTNDLHPLKDKIILLACRLSGDPLKPLEFQQQLQRSLCHHGDSPQSLNIMDISTDGFSFVLEEKVITCKLLPQK